MRVRSHVCSWAWCLVGGLALAGAACDAAPKRPATDLDVYRLDELGSDGATTATDLPLDVLRRWADRQPFGRTVEIELEGDAPHVGLRDLTTGAPCTLGELRIELERDGGELVVAGMVGVPHWLNSKDEDNPTFTEELRELGATLGDVAWVSEEQGALLQTSRPGLFVLVEREALSFKRDDGDADTRTITKLWVERRPGWLERKGFWSFARFMERNGEGPWRIEKVVAGLRDAAAAGAPNARALFSEPQHDARRDRQLALEVYAAEERFDRARDVLERCEILVAAAAQLDDACRPSPWPTNAATSIDSMKQHLAEQLASTASDRFEAAFHSWILARVQSLRPGSAAFDVELASRGRELALALSRQPSAVRLALLARNRREVDGLGAGASPELRELLQTLTRALADEFGASAAEAEKDGLAATAAGEQLLRRVLLGGELVPPPTFNCSLLQAQEQGEALRRATNGDDDAQAALVRARANALTVLARLAPFTQRTGTSDTDVTGFFSDAGADRNLLLWLGMDPQQEEWMSRAGVARLQYEQLALDVLDVQDGPRTTRVDSVTRASSPAATPNRPASEWSRSMAALRDQLNAVDAQIASAKVAATTPTAFHGFTHLEYEGSDSSGSYFRTVKDTETLASIMGRLDAAGSLDGLIDARNELVERYNRLADQRPFDAGLAPSSERVEYSYGTLRIDYRLHIRARISGPTGSSEYDGELEYRPVHPWRTGVPGTDVRGLNETLSAESQRKNPPWAMLQHIAERVASESEYRKRRDALAAELTARGVRSAQIDEELAWCDWLLCDPQWTLDPTLLRSITERVERLDQAAAAALPPR